VSRRVSLPDADELFRGNRNGHDRGHGGTTRELPPTQKSAQKVVEPAAQPVGQSPVQPMVETAAEKAKSSGRVRHDEKMTVYVTADELLDIEHARLSLRRHQGLAVDRGRLVREAIAIALADIELNGDDSVLVQRLIAR
jgi:hypothetical protein